MTTDRLVVVVHGVPAPQGSKRHVGHGVLVESSEKVAPWRAVVTQAAAAALQDGSWSPDRLAALSLHAVFTLSRPPSHYRTGRHSHELRPSAPDAPVTRPDLDKLIRSTLDALTDAGAFTDDARVVHVSAVKTYPDGHLDALDSPGAVLTLSEW